MQNSTRSHRRSKICSPYRTEADSAYGSAESLSTSPILARSTNTSENMLFGRNGLPLTPNTRHAFEHQPENDHSLNTFPSKQNNLSGEVDDEIPSKRRRARSDLTTIDLERAEHEFKGSRKRAKSDLPPTDTELEGSLKRGEKWTEWEEALLRERRTCAEPESWEATSTHFIGRTTNALQKKWKLMQQADAMKMEPYEESQLSAAYAKHAPGFYKNLAAELRMAGGDADIGHIEKLLSIMFIQHKLPLKDSTPSDGTASPPPPRARPVMTHASGSGYYSPSLGSLVGSSGSAEQHRTNYYLSHNSPKILGTEVSPVSYSRYGTSDSDETPYGNYEDIHGTLSNLDHCEDIPYPGLWTNSAMMLPRYHHAEKAYFSQLQL